MRRRKITDSSKALKAVKELDLFPKVPESYVETSASGGGISIVAYILMLILTISEISYYRSSDVKFDYNVDTNHTGKLKLNIDMTISMRCSAIGADVLDLTGQNVYSFGQLSEEDTYFELSPRQKEFHDNVVTVNKYIREEYHAIQDFLWSSGFDGLGSMPEREDKPGGHPDACRVSGTLEVNKVAGNFHVTAGKSIPVIPRGHAHLAMMVDTKEYNFSHRIDHFSFGERTKGIINPLDGDLQIAHENYHMYQYFVQIVPTSVKVRGVEVDTFQYAVTERNRSIDHSKGSHGLPGIFMKYDLSSIMVKVTEEPRPLWRFLVRMCGIVGGIFATSGIIKSLLGFLIDILCCRFKTGQVSADNLSSNKTLSPLTLNSHVIPPSVPVINLTNHNAEYNHTETDSVNLVGSHSDHVT